ncbi:MAG: pyridoxamine 5'-phosphate oxidase family protein [Actinomycetota bacterium]
MTTGRADSLQELPAHITALLAEERFAVMTTLSADGTAHSVPVVFAAVGNEIVSPIDHKPKSGQVMARVKNLARDDRVTLLVHHWDEEWANLLWLMVRGSAAVDDHSTKELMHAINARYSQYEPDERHDALIRITPTRLTWWTWA